VYKAEDIKLKRTVALKFLPSHSKISEQDRARFLQEAQAAAGLNHPNICVIHAIEEDNEQQFIVMECLDGVTLREKIASGALPAKQAVEYAVQIGEALQEAHSKGIVHRDIKADNIMINSKNQVKVMDFGLAKLKGAAKLTRTSSTVGTLAYMAPEQIQGGVVDARSDLFSLGVLLYEMLTAHFPFRGEHEAAMMYSTLNEDPEPLQKYLLDATAEIQNIIDKALEKDPEVRYQSAQDIVVDLRRIQRKSTRIIRGEGEELTGSEHAPEEAGHLSPGPPAVNRPAAGQSAKSFFTSYRKLIWSIGLLIGLIIIVSMYFIFLRGSSSASNMKSIAVLPFENLSPDKNNTYFVDGIQDEIQTNLSKIHDLKVIARSSSEKYGTRPSDLRTIGSQLGVATVLEGSVQRAEDQVHINVQLININNEAQIWAQSYSREIKDIFSVETEVAETIASALKAQLLPEEKALVKNIPTNDPKAYDMYLKAGYLLDQFGEGEGGAGTLFESEKLCGEAVQLDPTFALAWARMSYAHSLAYWNHINHSSEQIDSARAFAQKALDLQPNLPEAHLSMGYVHYWGHRDYSLALKDFKQAEEALPNNADVAAAIAFIRRRQGEWQDALEGLTRATELDPRNAHWLLEKGSTLAALGRYEDAIVSVDQASAIRPDMQSAISDKATCLVMLGRIKEARTVAASIKSNDMTVYYILSFPKFSIEMFSHDFDAAQSFLHSAPATFGYADFVIYRSVLIGEVFDARRDSSGARRAYKAAVGELEPLQKSKPDDPDIEIALGLAYAGMGRSSEALRDGQKAVDLLPLSKDSFDGSHYLIELAKINARLGRGGEAVEILKNVMSVVSGQFISPAVLRLDPVWNPIRNDPQFQELLKNYPEPNQ
ncbi:MAG: protein kinase, partial [Bacteroidota bacterium]